LQRSDFRINFLQSVLVKVALLRERCRTSTIQDLVEYALVVALIAFGAITGMRFLASGLNNAFSDIANVLTSNIT
jgi:Flp pilus assembly pilin Flp